MDRFWKPSGEGEERSAAYRPFFPLAFLGKTVTWLIPLAVLTAAVAGPWPGAIVAGLAAFLFDLLLQPVVQGLRYSMQEAVAQEEAPGRIFGVLNTILMGFNALLVIGLSALMATIGILPAFVVAAALYTAVGIFQWARGFKLLFPDGN